MKEHPIIFSAEMVRAILEGRKTQTRRVVKFNKPFSNHSSWPYVTKCVDGGWVWSDSQNFDASDPVEAGKQCPYGDPGDRLWVRESFCRTGAGETVYRADNKTDQPYWTLLKWKPSIHMPRWASRITLEITEVRVQRLQEISSDDVRAEGLDPDPIASNYFPYIWNFINSKGGYSWESNPWVWAITFKRTA